MSLYHQTRYTESYGDCSCSCHTQPGVVHCYPCCTPENGTRTPPDDEVANSGAGTGGKE